MANAPAKKRSQKSSKPSARKRARQSLKRHEHNRSLLTRMRTEIKRLRASLTARKKDQAQTLLKTTLAVIAKMAGKGIIHKNTAARYSSRLTQQFNKL